MKRLLPLFILGLTVADSSAENTAEASARFSNNDQIAGTLDSLSSGLLVWKSPALEKPTAFFLKNVLDITLPATPPASTADYEATLTLTNGDTVCGQLAEVTDQAVTLDTWFAGRLVFNRVMVAGVKIAAKATFVYRGPTSLDGWQQAADKPAWSYSNGAFVSHATGAISRAKLLPDTCATTFDIAWKGDALGLKVVLFSNEEDLDDPSSGYELSFQRGNIYLRNCGSQNPLGNTNAQVLMEHDKARIEIRASVKSGKVCLLVNDRLIETWSDPDVEKGRFGQGLHFIALNATPLRISGIRVAQWDGTIERTPEPRVGMMRRMARPGSGEDAKPAPPEKPKEERMELANGDSLSGEVVSISNGVIAVKTPLGVVQVPLARLRTVVLSKTDLERSKRRNGDIRARFADGTSMVFQLDEVKDGTLTGSSQNFGSATFKLAAFKRIEFNIYDPEIEDKRTSRDW